METGCCPITASSTPNKKVGGGLNTRTTQTHSHTAARMHSCPTEGLKRGRVVLTVANTATQRALALKTARRGYTCNA
eukprot:3563666-Pyramimonas_sp.AAC.1